jgi:hypothetical protein
VRPALPARPCAEPQAVALVPDAAVPADSIVLSVPVPVPLVAPCALHANALDDLLFTQMRHCVLRLAV